MFANVNRGKDQRPYSDVGVFLPHPGQWRLQTNERSLNIDRTTAIEFLQTYKSFGADVLVIFDDWLDEIQLIASY